MSQSRFTNLLLALNIVLAIVVALLVVSPWETHPGNEFKVALKTYARLETRNAKGKVVALASGVRLNNKLILSCAHLFADTQHVFFEREKLKTFAYDRKSDLALFKVNTAEDNLSNVIIRKTVVPSREVFNCSNANGNSGTLNYYLITYYDRGKGVFHLDKPVIPGESGSGLFDSRGGLVGISVADNPVTFITDPENFVNYGVATSSKTIIKFLSSVRDRDCDEYYNEAIVRNWFDRIMWRFY